MEERRQPVGFCGDANDDIAFPHLHVMLHCLFSFFLFLVFLMYRGEESVLEGEIVQLITHLVWAPRGIIIYRLQSPPERPTPKVKQTSTSRPCFNSTLEPPPF